MNAKSQLNLWVILLLLSTTAHAEVFDEQFDVWPLKVKINGTVIASNASKSDEVDKYFVRTSGGDDAKVVVLVYGTLTEDKAEELEKRFAAAGSIEVTITDSAKAIASFAEKAKDASGVYLTAVRPLNSADLDALTQLGGNLQHTLSAGGTVFAEGELCSLLSSVHAHDQQMREGMGLFPDCLIDPQVSGEQEWKALEASLSQRPRMVGIGLERETTVILAGRKIQVSGDGAATVILAAHKGHKVKRQRIQKPGRRQRPKQFLIDLTQWRREAIDRSIAAFPPENPKAPFVDKGTLVIVGGGGMPKGLMERFVELAGGAKDARLVYVPCSERDTVSTRQGIVDYWKRLGVKNATFIHTKDRAKANTDAEFLKPLQDATGIWFGGGRQWNFADSYYGTEAHRLMKEVVNRGGVVGGSSAGASIQARYLARATPIENFDIMAPGYERGGLGFISGVAIDQHFSQRNRQKDMTSLVNRYPQMLGIGLDEATAIVVQGSIAEVVGRGKTHFYDRNLPVVPNQPDYIALPAGSRYDLAKRVVLKDATKKTDDEGQDKDRKNE